MAEMNPPERIEQVRVRKVPKYSVFLVVGGAVGLVVAAILTYTFQGSDSVSPSTGLVYTDGQVFGFLALICIVVGLAVFGLLALVLDRLAARRARTYTADHETVRASTDAANEAEGTRGPE